MYGLLHYSIHILLETMYLVLFLFASNLNDTNIQQKYLSLPKWSRFISSSIEELLVDISFSVGNQLRTLLICLYIPLNYTSMYVQGISRQSLKTYLCNFLTEKPFRQVFVSATLKLVKPSGTIPN